MRDLAALTVDDFHPLQGATFRLRWGDAEVPLVLEEVTAVGKRPGHRDPFALLFRGPADGVLPQQIHHLTGDGFGEAEIFLVPVGADGDGVLYEAVFT